MILVITTLSLPTNSPSLLPQRWNASCPTGKTKLFPDLKEGKTVLIAAHGNSLRALVKHLDNIDSSEISELNIPTGVPLVYELDDDLKPIPQADALAPLTGRYLGDVEAIRARIEGVKNQTK